MDRALAGTRLSVAVTGVLGLVSVVTGIANIAYGDVAVIGPLQPYVPEAVRVAAGFSGTITGFCMLLGAFGLKRRLRVGWWVSVVLVPVTAAQGLIQSSPLSIPLVVLSVVAVPVLLFNRRRFDGSVDLTSTQIAAGVALVGVQAYGTVGAWALRDEFTNVETPLDAFYFTIVTASTVGYGDITASSGIGRLFAITVLLFGVASFGVAIGSLVTPIIEARLAAALGRDDERLSLLEDHVVILGYGDLTEPVVAELAGRRDFVVVTREPGQVSDLTSREILTLAADPTDETSMERANVSDAAVVIAATNNDARDAFGVLTARELHPNVRIVAAASNAENVGKLERAGADVVVDPAQIGGKLLVGAAGADGRNGSAAGSRDSEPTDPAAE